MLLWKEVATFGIQKNPRHSQPDHFVRSSSHKALLSWVPEQDIRRQMKIGQGNFLTSNPSVWGTAVPMGVLRFTMSGVLGHFNVTARLHEIKVRMKSDGKYVTSIFGAEILNVITWGVIHVSWRVWNCDSFVSLVIHGTSNLKLGRKHEILSATSAWPNYGDQLSSRFS